MQPKRSPAAVSLGREGERKTNYALDSRSRLNRLSVSHFAATEDAMSTNSECQFIEPKPGQWFYILEDYSAPKNSWDWREYSTCYGPFPSQKAADDHLCRNHANPGGSEVIDHANYKSDEMYENLVATARNPRSRW